MKKSQPMRVLIVDDTVSARETIRAQLAASGYDLSFAESGAQGLRHVREEKPDLVLLDVMMPEMNGYEVCRAVKEDPEIKHIPIILVTALNSRDDLLHGFDAGADDFISKPFNGPELRARVRSMLRIKAQYDELEAVARLRADMEHVIVHDMRTSIYAISLASNLLLKDDLPEGVQQTVRMIKRGEDELYNLVDNLLFYAKSESKGLRLEPHEVDLRDIVRGEVERSEAHARQVGVKLKVNLSKEVVPATVDVALLRRLISNLVGNAIKHSPVDSRVEVNLANRGGGEDGLVLQVRDQGPGIPARFRDSIFEKFESMPSKEAMKVSFGLGLYFCRLVVDAHGGEISVEDNEPNGTVFTVTLPAGAPRQEPVAAV